jgi:hypothetical protein
LGQDRLGAKWRSPGALPAGGGFLEEASLKRFQPNGDGVTEFFEKKFQPNGDAWQLLTTSQRQ